jgi:3-oxo-5-alpha-steroid 4-dehydrogenase 1
MQTRYLLYEAPVVEMTATTYGGAALWLTGLLINVQADNILISLRKDKKKKGDYKIPRGGMFEYVSAANYFGEIVEWTGFAVASEFALPCVAFAVFTFANLFPRALAYHRFYLDRFPSYAKLNRKACIPFVV